MRGNYFVYVHIFGEAVAAVFSIAVDVIAAFTGNWFFLNMCSRQKAGEFDCFVIG